jgi:hypothetical protein
MWEIFPRQLNFGLSSWPDAVDAFLQMNVLNGTTPSPALVRALRRTLRPLVRLMLGSGVTYPLVSELLKGIFVEVSDREFRLGAKAPTDSRISLISGVHRKDVRRLRSADQAIEEVVPDTISFGGKLVTTWLSDERFLDEVGRPRPLSKTRTPGEPACFEELVADRSTDIRPRVVLDEWLRLGIVHIDPHDRLVLNTDAFVPQAGLDEKLFFFAHNLHDHAAAATDNLLGNRAPQLERSLMYDGLTEGGIALLDKRARQLGTRMLRELNRLASEREEAEAASTAPRRRFTCGVYFYSEPAPDPGPASNEP